MPITVEKHLCLLEAAEDALQALQAMRRTMEREASLVEQGRATAQGALDNILLMCQPTILMSSPVNSEVTIRGERQFYSPTRMGALRRARRHRAKQTANSSAPSSSQPLTEDEVND